MASSSAANNDPLGCPSIAQYLAMMTVLPQPDIVEAMERGADDAASRERSVGGARPPRRRYFRSRTFNPGSFEKLRRSKVMTS